MPGLREAEPDLAKQIDAAMATIAANGAAASAAAESLASAAKAAEAAGSGASNAAAAAAFGGTPGRSREGNAAGFPTAMPATPANPNALFSTINAETLEASAQNVTFPVPEDKARGGGPGRGPCPSRGGPVALSVQQCGVGGGGLVGGGAPSWPARAPAACASPLCPRLARLLTLPRLRHPASAPQTSHPTPPSPPADHRPRALHHQQHHQHEH